MKNIGIFPLNLVLFHESAYPLHIFEDRYKTLIKECYDQSITFGITYLTPQGMNHIGCSAIVSDIFKSYPDGRMDILIAGVKRFKITNLKDGVKPYYTAEVEYFDDDQPQLNILKLYQCTDLFNQVVAKIKTVKIDNIYPDQLKTSKPSFLIAQKAGLSTEQKQTLIEMRSENERLDYLTNHLKKLTPIIMQSETISQIIKNDGYFKPKNK